MNNNYDLIEITENTKNAMGGTELLMHRIYDGKIPRSLLEKVQIIPSRVRELSGDKHKILYLHDNSDDPEAQHLANNGWSKFHKLVFVSYTQRNEYIKKFDIPYSKTVVLHNSITKIPVTEKPKDKINLIYHTTPHRGLEILVPVFEKLAETDPEIHLDVYSSFSVYGWDERDKPYEPLFERIKNHKQMTYHGAVSNESVRDAVAKSHIFAYPAVWQETSCLALIEAMSAGCICVHPNFGALPETGANWTMMYNFDENINNHANTFYGMLQQAIKYARGGELTPNLKSQKVYADMFYNWEYRSSQWEALIESVIAEPLELAEIKEMFVFDTSGV